MSMVPVKTNDKQFVKFDGFKTQPIRKYSFINEEVRCVKEENNVQTTATCLQGDALKGCQLNI